MPKTNNFGRKARKTKQRKVKRYQKLREDLQLDGTLPTTAEGAVKLEVVDPSAQGEQRFPALIGRAIRQGWAVPDEKKPRFVDELAEVLEDPDANQVAKVMAFNALLKGDAVQAERDQEFIRTDQVLEMWRGALEAIRANISDPVLLKAVISDVLRFLPAPSAGLVLGGEVSTAGEPEGRQV